MPYRYVASTEEGKVVKGVSDLLTAKSVQEDIESQGLVVVSIEPIKSKRKFRRIGLDMFGFISHVEKVVFTKHLAIMVKAGLPLLESLRILRDQASSRKFRSVLNQVVQSVESGQSLSNGLAKHPKIFSPFFVNVVRAGEVAGSMETNLEHMAEQFSKDHELRQKVRNALMYPVIVLVAALGIGFFFAIYVLPQVTGLFSGLRGVELPLATQVLINIANFAKDHTMAMLGGTVALIVFLAWFLRLKLMKPYVHGLILHLPIVGGLAQNINLARFSMVLGTQLRSGIPIVQALEVTADVLDNWHFKKAIIVCMETVRRGGALSDAMADLPEIFPRLVARMIEVGERSGRSEEILGFLSEFYTLEVETTMKNLTTILEPVMLLIVGLLAVFLAYAIIIPIYNFVSAIGEMGRA